MGSKIEQSALKVVKVRSERRPSEVEVANLQQLRNMHVFTIDRIGHVFGKF